MSNRYEFSTGGRVGTVRYRDGEWHAEIEGRKSSHRLLRVALAHALGVGPADVGGLAAKILTEARDEKATPGA